MNYLMGDLQGCAEALERMLAEIGFSPSRDHLVVLGDLVNRGPGSLAVLQRLRGLDSAATCLLGNHDLHLLAVAHGVRHLHRKDTFQDVLQAPNAAAWIEWLSHLPLAHESCGWLCVHAGVLPQWTAEQTLALASEVQAQLSGLQRASFLQVMYGNVPAQWHDRLQGADRLRCIVNALTRLRFCTAEGTMHFEAKGDADAAPPDCLPWFEAPDRRTAGRGVAFGHWSTLSQPPRDDLLALDTGCVWGGCLTAVRVDGGRRERVRVQCRQAQRPGPD